MVSEIQQSPDRGSHSGLSQEQEKEDKMIGVVLDERYKIVELIGEGGMGSIYRAEDQRLTNRPVAVKIIHPHLQLTDIFVERFEVEQQALAKVRSPHIVAIQDVGEYQHRPYFVMEYIEGQGLDVLMKREGALPLPQVVNIAEQVARALDAAHQEGVIHRDVKPSNILLSDPVVKLTDFGVARLEDSPHLTSGGVVGTALYMAPDQIDPDGKVDRRSDVYSLGAVLYHMLTGKPPFDYDTQWKVAQAHLAKKPLPPRRLSRNVTRPVEKVVLKALQKKREGRYASAGALAQALKEAASAKPARLSRSSLLIAVLFGLLMLLGIALGKSMIGAIPTSAPTVAAAAVPSLTSTPTETATPQVSGPRTGTPTPLSSSPTTISSFVFATGVDDAGQPLGQGTTFRPKDREVYAFFDYSGLSDGIPIRWAWYLNGRKIEEGQDAWSKGQSGTTYLKIGTKTGYLTPGSYRLDLFLGDGPVAGGLVRSGTFAVEIERIRTEIVEEETPTPTVTPTPPLARMLYTVWSEQGYQVYTANTDGSDSWFAAGPANSPSWSPDGQQISFSGEAGIAEGIGLYTMRIGEEPKRYVSKEVRHTRWSPDGTRIAYDAQRVGFASSKLFLCPLEKVPYECELLGLPGEMPDWNPQGDMLVYRDCDEEGNCSLSIVDVDHAGGMTRRRPIPNTGDDFSPDWSPDGSLILFSRKVNEHDFDIYTIKLDGSELRRLTSTVYLEVTPSWTPDGQQILFRSNRGGDWGIYIMKADGTSQRKIIDAPTGTDWGIATIDATGLP
jgi:serine/threonine protein kinase